MFVSIFTICILHLFRNLGNISILTAYIKPKFAQFDIVGHLVCTTVFIKSNFFLFKLPVFFLPLRLHWINSSLPKIASRTRAIASSLSFATSFPGWSFNTFSMGCSFGGVKKGGEGGDGACFADSQAMKMKTRNLNHQCYFLIHLVNHLKNTHHIEFYNGSTCKLDAVDICKFECCCEKTGCCGITGCCDVTELQDAVVLH